MRADLPRQLGPLAQPLKQLAQRDRKHRRPQRLAEQVHQQEVAVARPEYFVTLIDVLVESLNHQEVQRLCPDLLRLRPGPLVHALASADGQKEPLRQDAAPAASAHSAGAFVPTVDDVVADAGAGLRDEPAHLHLGDADLFCDAALCLFFEEPQVENGALSRGQMLDLAARRSTTTSNDGSGMPSVSTSDQPSSRTGSASKESAL